MSKKETNKSHQNTTDLAVQVNGKTGLTDKQERAAILLAAGTTATATAEQVGVDRCTLYEWRKMITFQCYYNRQCAEYKDSIKNGLFGLVDEALNVIRGAMRCDNDTVRLKAAQYVLERVSSTETGDTDAVAVLKQRFKKYPWESAIEADFDSRLFERELKNWGLDK